MYVCMLYTRIRYVDDAAINSARRGIRRRGYADERIHGERTLTAGRRNVTKFRVRSAECQPSFVQRKRRSRMRCDALRYLVLRACIAYSSWLACSGLAMPLISFSLRMRRFRCVDDEFSEGGGGFRGKMKIWLK